MTSRTRTIRLEVGDGDGSGRTDAFLAARLPDLSRSRLRALIDAGHVTCNGAPTKPRQPVQPGDSFEIIIPPDQPADALPEDIAVDILHEDEDLAVIHKPHGMVVHPGAGHHGGTLVNALLHRWGSLSSIGGVERPGIVHRLDKDTSGLLVVARNDPAHESLARQFADREVIKVYLAVVRGRPPGGGGAVDAPVGRHPVNRRKMAVVDPARGRHAVTDWAPAPTRPDAPGCSTLVICRLHTGRTHQIRVHLAHLGHPLLGDPLYGGKSGTAPRVDRLMLHAWQLAFRHPRDGRTMRFTARPPEAFAPWQPPAGWENLPAPA